MTKIIPFKALMYNQKIIKDVSKVVCPPYDVISPEQQEYYYQKDPHNLIHILLAKDKAGDNKYERSGKYFKEWIKENILISEEMPSIYFYSQLYNLKGEKRTRYGFIALLRLGNSNSGVYGHENTHMPAKEDRFRLLKQVKANLSPIFVLFPDQKRIIARMREKFIQGQAPSIELTDDDKTVHKIWRISSPEIVSAVQEKMTDENIFIADGHHRYEVSCAYQEEMKQLAGKSSQDESFDYILAYFTNLDPRGLTIMPIHRLVRLKEEFNMREFQNLLSEYFDVEEVKDRNKFFFLLNKAAGHEHILGMYKNKKFWFIRLKNIKILDKIIKDKPYEYRILDVSILNHIVLKKILGLDLDDKEVIRFSPDCEELIETVNKEADKIAFFLNPVKVEQIMSVAIKGEKMPPKSTYFYPKVLSGLVINKLE